MGSWVSAVGVVVMAVAFGGLLVAAAVLLARALATSMRDGHHPAGQRLARLHVRAVWRQVLRRR